MKAHWRKCPRCEGRGWVFTQIMPDNMPDKTGPCPTCKGLGRIRVRAKRKAKKAKAPKPLPSKFIRHWNIKAGKRGMKASVAFQRIGKKR